MKQFFTKTGYFLYNNLDCFISGLFGFLLNLLACVIHYNINHIILILFAILILCIEKLKIKYILSFIVGQIFSLLLFIL